LFATVITLFLVPLCYLAVDDLGQVFRLMLGKRETAQPEMPAQIANS
jgi:hypothetical protein